MVCFRKKLLHCPICVSYIQGRKEDAHMDRELEKDIQSTVLDLYALRDLMDFEEPVKQVLHTFYG